MELNATSVMTVLATLVAFIKLIKELMVAAQAEFAPGTGAEKKMAVLDGLPGIIGNETVWDKVKGIFSVAIDCISIFKPKEKVE
jgi:hypothetical protein